MCDFYGLGKTIPCNYNHEKVSCVLICTKVGKEFFRDVVKERNLFVEERPVKEALEGNPRLTHPNAKTDARLQFEQNIQRANGDFEMAIKPPVEQYIKLGNTSKIRLYCNVLMNKLKRIIGK